MNDKITALRVERQHLSRRADEAEYMALYRDLQPGQNVYWNGFGNPPSLTYRADFDDVEFNRGRQRTHALIKGRFAGGNLGWIMPEDLELFAAAFIKPLDKPLPRQLALLELIEREPLTIQQMKEETGMLVKEITPVLHRFQEAFLIYEDQYDGEWDRGWHKFSDMFPHADLAKYSRHDALLILLRRFAFRHVRFDAKMAKSFYKLPEKEIKTAISALLEDGSLVESDCGYILCADAKLLKTYAAKPPKFAYAMHRNDFLVKSNEHWLKEKYAHTYPDTLYYILIDGEFRGAAAGKFRYTPEVEDVILDLPEDEANGRKDEILRAVHVLCGENNPIKNYRGAKIHVSM
jgi:predicted transcriptional regulator